MGAKHVGRRKKQLVRRYEDFVPFEAQGKRDDGFSVVAWLGGKHGDLRREKAKRRLRPFLRQGKPPHSKA